MAGRSSLTIVQMNNSHAYFDLHQEMFWQGSYGYSYAVRLSRFFGSHGHGGEEGVRRMYICIADIYGTN